MAGDDTSDRGLSYLIHGQCSALPYAALIHAS